VSIGEKQAGFLVDEVSDIVSIGDQEIQPAPDVEIGEPSVILGLVRVESRTMEARGDDTGQMILLLDLDGLSLTRHLELVA
ncbi:chemotaxis protein CheW, partial [Acinetobacter baumannii]